MHAETIYLDRPPAVIDIPRERGQFHDENHLRSGDLEGLVAQIEDRPDDMASRRDQHEPVRLEEF